MRTAFSAATQDEGRFAVLDYFKTNREFAKLYGALDQEHVGAVVLHDHNERIAARGCGGLPQ
jgi:deoxycytidylate deaminase